MTLKERLINRKRIEESMRRLARDSNFADFIENLRWVTESVLEESLTDAVIKCPRRHMAACGALRTYSEIIQMYEQLLANLHEAENPPPPPEQS